MIDFFNFILVLVLFTGALWFAYMSSVLVSEKKARYRAGTHDYYDNPLKDQADETNMASTASKQKSAKTSSTKAGIFDKSKVKYFDGDNT